MTNQDQTNRTQETPDPDTGKLPSKEFGPYEDFSLGDLVVEGAGDELDLDDCRDEDERNAAIASAIDSVLSCLDDATAEAVYEQLVRAQVAADTAQ